MSKIRHQAERGINPGFSLLELLIVLAIVALVAALSAPGLMSAVRTSRLRGAGSDFAGLLQQARMRAIQDDRFYSVYPYNNNGLPEEFVDIYPQAINGASGSNGQTLDPKDPVISLSAEVSPQPWGAAPNTPNLLAQMLGANPSNLAPVGNYALAPPAPPTAAPPATGPPTFGPEGQPCTPFALTLGTVCNSQGGPVGYWVFFQDNVSQNWEAVTVTPAGRIQKWYYTGAAWAKL